MRDVVLCKTGFGSLVMLVDSSPVNIKEKRPLKKQI